MTLTTTYWPDLGLAFGYGPSGEESAHTSRLGITRTMSYLATGWNGASSPVAASLYQDVRLLANAADLEMGTCERYLTKGVTASRVGNRA